MKSNWPASCHWDSGGAVAVIAWSNDIADVGKIMHAGVHVLQHAYLITMTTDDRFVLQQHADRDELSQCNLVVDAWR